MVVHFRAQGGDRDDAPARRPDDRSGGVGQDPSARSPAPADSELGLRWPAGVAPPSIPVWSGNSDRQRLKLGGNRQVNAALHLTAVTQWRDVGESGRLYIERRMAT